VGERREPSGIAYHCVEAVEGDFNVHTQKTAVALGFGLAVLFWWEVAEPIRSTSWRGSAEQWLALASAGIGVCATLVAVGGALFALFKTPRRDD
jgi:hypothetical protein